MQNESNKHAEPANQGNQDPLIEKITTEEEQNQQDLERFIQNQEIIFDEFVDGEHKKLIEHKNKAKQKTEEEIINWTESEKEKAKSEIQAKEKHISQKKKTNPEAFETAYDAIIKDL